MISPNIGVIDPLFEERDCADNAIKILENEGILNDLLL
jgi:hypothetical protein